MTRTLITEVTSLLMWVKSLIASTQLMFCNIYTIIECTICNLIFHGLKEKASKLLCSQITNLLNAQRSPNSRLNIKLWLASSGFHFGAFVFLSTYIIILDVNVLLLELLLKYFDPPSTLKLPLASNIRKLII